MMPLADIFGIPNEALTLLFLVLLSLVNWIKNRFLEQQEKEQREAAEKDPAREVVWRRQTGEDAAPRELHGGGPPPIRPGTIRLDPRPPGPPRGTPVPRGAAPARPAVAVVSKRQAALADAFENLTGGPKRRGNGHRREVDKLLRSPSAAQNAILLMEILGPPVALKPSEERFP